MASQQEQAIGALQGLGLPQGMGGAQQANAMAAIFGLSVPGFSGAGTVNPSAIQPPGGVDGFSASGDQEQEQQEMIQMEIQQLLQEIQQLSEELQQAEQQDPQEASNLQNQLAQDESALQGLQGGGGSGGGGGCASAPMGGGGGGGSAAPVGGGGGGGASCAASSSGASCASGSSGGSTYDGSNGSVSNQTLLNNVKTVEQVAEKDGVNPQTAVATMLTESNGNNTAVGDGGTSFGLFQLHQGGELGNLTQAQADNPLTNAQVAIGQMAQTQKATGDTGGALAAAAQRPANPGAYAATVNNNMSQAASLIKQANG